VGAPNRRGSIPFNDAGPSDSNRDIALVNSANNLTDAVDWRTPMIAYLCNPSIRANRNV
jgi:hypothetical protein